MHIAEWLDLLALGSILEKLLRDSVPLTAEELDKTQWEQARHSFVHLEVVVKSLQMNVG